MDAKLYSGSKTAEDYYALPEGSHIELIDGCFRPLYDMSAPGTMHQSLLGVLYVEIFGFIRSKKGVSPSSRIVTVSGMRNM